MHLSILSTNVVRPAGRSLPGLLSLAILTAFAAPSTGTAQCPEEPQFQNFTGAGSTVCPCFVVGEEAGAVFNVPASHYPIEILKVGIGWGSQFGGAPQSQESAIKIYSSGLPNPGAPIFSLPGPIMNDGFINEFNLEPLPGTITVSSEFSVTLTFLNQNAGNIFAPSVVHDGNGCTPTRNLVFAIPGGWADACLLGVTGDWVFYVKYRQANCTATGVEEELFATNVPAALFSPSPNPFTSETRINFLLGSTEQVRLAVYDIRGRLVDTLADETFSAGRHSVSWTGADRTGAGSASGVYFLRMEAGDYRETKKLVLNR